MKTTYFTTGFLTDAAYSGGLLQFLQQYNDRFPGLSYLHVSLEQAISGSNTNEEILHYYGDGKCLRIRLVKEATESLPSPFEIYEELRLVFDIAVEHHLNNHQHTFFAENYL